MVHGTATSALSNCALQNRVLVVSHKVLHGPQSSSSCTSYQLSSTRNKNLRLCTWTATHNSHGASTQCN